MRLVFVNHAHPDLPHVSGMRLSHFAHALAELGHEVILLTASLPSENSGDVGGSLADVISTHCWSHPLHISVTPTFDRSLKLIRTGQCAVPLRRCLTFWYLACRGGVFDDWVEPCRAYVRTLCSVFNPHLAWGTFGNTSNLFLAQLIGRTARCPWLIDVKDNWCAFIPTGLRHFLAWRFRDAAGYTSNATHHESIAAPYLRQRRKRVIYSGVAPEFLRREPDADAVASRELILVGGTYSKETLIAFLSEFGRWLRLNGDRCEGIRFVYAGTDRDRVRNVIADIALKCDIELADYLPLKELAKRCRKAWANCYIRAPFTFHHKLLELLSCGRPLISYPEEAGESLALARHFTTPFISCGDPSALTRAFDYAWERRDQPARPQTVTQWTWNHLAQSLAVFFSEVRSGAQ